MNIHISLLFSRGLSWRRIALSLPDRLGLRCEDQGCLRSGMDAGGVSLDELLGSFASEPEPDSEAAPAAALGPYRCLRRTLVRDGYEAFSSVLGAL
eukprot:COSAG02_NODE_38807_length_424_cov_2.073846_1_plen_95_part_01